MRIAQTKLSLCYAAISFIIISIYGYPGFAFVLPSSRLSKPLFVDQFWTTTTTTTTTTTITTTSSTSSPSSSIFSLQQSKWNDDELKWNKKASKQWFSKAFVFGNKKAGIATTATTTTTTTTTTAHSNKNELEVQQTSSSKSFLSKTKRNIKYWMLLAFTVLPISSPNTMPKSLIKPANAVYRIPNMKRAPSREEQIMKKLKEGQERELVAPDPNDPKYRTQEGWYEMDLKIYEERLRLKEEKNAIQKEEMERREMERNELQKERMKQDTLASPPSIQNEAKSSPQLDFMSQYQTSKSGSDESGSSLGTISKPKMSIKKTPKVKSQKKARTAKQSLAKAVLPTVSFGVITMGGVAWSRNMNRAERNRVKKGIELFESQKAEFFNVTGKADTDDTLAGELEKLKGNSTDTTDGDEDDGDEDDGDEDEDDEDDIRGGGGGGSRKPRGGIPGGDSGGGGAPSTGAGGSGTSSSSTSSNSSPTKPPSEEERIANDDDVERMKRLFDK